MNEQAVLILGLGASGLAMARWCSRQGARVTVADTRETPPQLAVLRAECPDASFVAGPFDDALLARAEWNLIARSPGLAPEVLQGVFGWAKERNVAVVGELDLFARALRELSQRERLPYKPKVLAITGTNGKTTVTSLTGLLLQRAGLNVAVAGNIGPALLDVLSAALDTEAVAQAADDERAAAEAAQAQAEAEAQAANAVQAPPVVVDEAPAVEGDAEADPVAEEVEAIETPASDEAEDDGPTQLVPPPVEPPQPAHLPQAWVLELSSFQLDGTAGGDWDSVPTAATVLNLTEDHLDWHGSMAAYALAKKAVFGAQALMLLNRDDPLVMGMQPGLVTVKVGNRNRQQSARPWASFGLDAPTRAGDWGIETVNGMTWLVRALALDETRKRGRGAEEDEETYFQRLMPVDALRIRGRHNAANALAALALASSTGAALGPMLHGLREYRGEPHRVEPVAIIDEVEYFDDSKGTNVGATLAAVSGLGVERRLVVILGGDGKGQDFTPLAEPLARFARAVVYIGRDAARIREAVGAALAQANVPQLDSATLPEAVALCAQQARPGDAVLMSPACASLDMFDNYMHRARVFVDAVHALAAEQGLSLEGGPVKKKTVAAAKANSAPWGQRVRAALTGLLPRFPGRDLAGALAGGSSRDDLPVRLSNRTYAGTRNVAVRELGFDQPLLWVVVALLAWGLVMVYSASIALPDNPRFQNYAHTHFVLRHGISMVIGVIAAMVAFQLPLRSWEKMAPWLFAVALVLLALVLLPFIGRGVNGARRWISLGIMNFQPSELAKLAVLLYAASYMVRKMEVKERFFHAVAPMAVAVGVVGMLLLAEPDMGAFMVIVVIAMGILFLGGVNARMFFLMALVVVGAFALMVMTSEFRRQRVFAYLDPWSVEHALGKGYQLSHSLIAFGRGEIFGVGLGGSVEKLHWLPEAHTDFLLAVIGEEFGLLGVVVLIALFLWLTRRIMHIGRQAIALDQVFAGLVAQGVGLWMGFQAFINIGVNLGALPTKGLTLPLMSYGGSAILLNLVAIALVLRVDYENRQMMKGGRA